MAESTKIL